MVAISFLARCHCQWAFCLILFSYLLFILSCSSAAALFNHSQPHSLSSAMNRGPQSLGGCFLGAPCVDSSGSAYVVCDASIFSVRRDDDGYMDLIEISVYPGKGDPFVDLNGQYGCAYNPDDHLIYTMASSYYIRIGSNPTRLSSTPTTPGSVLKVLTQPSVGGSGPMAPDFRWGNMFVVSGTEVDRAIFRLDTSGNAVRWFNFYHTPMVYKEHMALVSAEKLGNPKINMLLGDAHGCIYGIYGPNAPQPTLILETTIAAIVGLVVESPTSIYFAATQRGIYWFDPSVPNPSPRQVWSTDQPLFGLVLDGQRNLFTITPALIHQWPIKNGTLHMIPI